MLCYHCKSNTDVPWMNITNVLEEDEIGGEGVEGESNDGEGEVKYVNKHICGYSCYKRLSESGSLPKSLWKNIINKEDFQGYLRPVSRYQKKRFEYLSYDEIKTLTDVEKETYMKGKDQQFYLNPEIQIIHEEILEEDMRTAELEENTSESEYLSCPIK